jgi:hypothetical protein
MMEFNDGNGTHRLLVEEGGIQLKFGEFHVRYGSTIAPHLSIALKGWRGDKENTYRATLRISFDDLREMVKRIVPKPVEIGSAGAIG